MTKLKSKVACIGGVVSDKQMIVILLQSLPSKEFSAATMMLQSMGFYHEVIIELLTSWEITFGKDAEEHVADMLATSTGLNCGNCHRDGHSKDVCWACGGGKEGQGPPYWVAPVDKEPCKVLLDTHKARWAAHWTKRGTLTPTPPAITATTITSCAHCTGHTTAADATTTYTLTSLCPEDNEGVSNISVLHRNT